jgi:hypothetical protein
MALQNGLRLTSPTSGTTIATPLTAILTWEAIAPDASYAVTIATDPKFGRVVVKENDLADTSLRVALCPEQIYWWQVYLLKDGMKIPATNGPWSFTTPAPIVRDGAPASEKYGAARPKGHFAVPYEPYIMEALPEDPTMPLSPWFDKKAYDLPPLPKFDDVKPGLPVPVLEGAENQNLIDTYWYAWRLAFEEWFYEPKEKDQAVAFMNACSFWAGWGSMQYFDSSYIMQYARYANGAFPYITTFDNVYCRQHENGFIMKETDSSNYEVWSSDPTLPPVFPWAEWEYYLVSGDRGRLVRILLPIVKYYEWLQRYQRRDDGLFYTDQGGHGDWEVSMNGTMAQFAWCAGQIAKTVGRRDLAAYFNKEAKTITTLIEAKLWDDEHGIYSARYKDGFATEPEPGRLYKIIHAACPLMEGKAPRARAKKVIRQILDSKVFMGKYGVRGLSDDSYYFLTDNRTMTFVPNEGRTDNMLLSKEQAWAPWQVEAIKALEAYGYTDEAADLGERYARAIAATYAECGDITEHAWTEKLGPGGCPRFVGWSGYGPIACLIEQILGFHCDAPNKRLYWRIRQTARHGIEKLAFGGITASLVCEARKSVSDSCQITIEASDGFELVVDNGSGAKAYQIASGHSKLSVGD